MTILLALVVVGMAAAQTAVDPALLDLSKAKLSAAGPDQIYVRSIQYGGTEVSVLLKYDGANGVTIQGPYLPGQKVLPDSTDLDSARLELGISALWFYDAVIAGRSYSGSLVWDGGTKLTLASAITGAPPETAQQKIARLEAETSQIGTYKAEAARLETELAGVRGELAAARTASGATTATAVTATAGPAWRPALDLSRFAGLKPTAFGTWSMTTGALAQTDTKLKYAKYVVPFSQTAQQTLYGFSAKAGGTGWAGYGLHFFASGSARTDRYGLGRSFLVWLTRDPGYYGTKDGYVQLYQSSDDVTMVQLASVKTTLDLSRPVRVEVIYDRTARTVQVLLNGALALSQRVEAIPSGDAIAARSLGGGVEFLDLYVKAF